ncbi:insulin-degrading enzyme-like [Gordionus sp. m RMFG-2023]|uniref:insulin-degrading enzyme-like n=1 Tax=Gordionus sp. m RMFG-2023 TaxID=3053472 RepID=UPI0031FD9CFE
MNSFLRTRSLLLYNHIHFNKILNSSFHLSVIKIKMSSKSNEINQNLIKMNNREENLDLKNNDIENKTHNVNILSSNHMTNSQKRRLSLLNTDIESYVTYVEDNITKSETDNCTYRGLELKNKLKVLLISDPEADKAAAALDVHIGNLKDPKTIPGLAHFCEHMLFMGTKKYPSENEYSKFLNEHSGCSNAYTCDDHTNYYFDVAPEHLKGALDRFAQFFITPLFTPSATEREAKAVHAENDKNLQQDSWRFHQLERHICHPEQDFHKFGTGNKKTLLTTPKATGLDVHKELLKFHHEWYSSNIMGLAVLGKESIDELTEWVVEMFGGVENKNITIPEWNQNPYTEEYLQLLINVVPVKDLRYFYITFPIPDLTKFYKSSPGNIIGHLIAHEGENSILSYLKAKGWINSICGGSQPGAKGYMFFTISGDLTEIGIDNVEEIISTVFQYIDMLKRELPQPWIFEECRDIGALQFRFHDKKIPDSYVSDIASKLQDYPLNDVLSCDYILTEYRPDLVMKLLDCLTPERMRVYVVGRKFTGMTDQKEPWYGTDHSSKKISPEIIQKWLNPGKNPKLSLPKPNSFIPNDFTIYAKTGKSEQTPMPYLIKDDPKLRIWFKQDDTYLLPKSYMNFEFLTPLAYLDPANCNMTYLYVQLFKDAITEYAYNAELAGLSYNMENTKQGLNLSVRGYNQKQLIFLDELFAKMKDLVIEPKRFEIIKESHTRNLKNFFAELPYHHAMYFTNSLLDDSHWSKDELIESLQDISHKDVQNYIPRLFARFCLNCLVYGNFTSEQAFSVSSLVDQNFVSTKPLFTSQIIKSREHVIPKGSYYIYQVDNPVHKSTAIDTYYQIGLRDIRNTALLDLVSQIIGEPCFDILRTKEQLGYVCMTSVRQSNSVHGLRVVIQSDRMPSFLDSRIEAFLLHMEDYISEMNDSVWQKNVESVIINLSEKPKKMVELGYKYWGEIISNQYNFDRDQLEIEEIKRITKDDLLKFFQEFFSPESSARKKLSTHVIPSSDEFTSKDDTDIIKIQKKKSRYINDPGQFKTGLGLYPLTKPCLDVGSAGLKARFEFHGALDENNAQELKEEASNNYDIRRRALDHDSEDSETNSSPSISEPHTPEEVEMEEEAEDLKEGDEKQEKKVTSKSKKREFYRMI